VWRTKSPVVVVHAEGDRGRDGCRDDPGQHQRSIDAAPRLAVLGVAERTRNGDESVKTRERKLMRTT